GCEQKARGKMPLHCTTRVSMTSSRTLPPDLIATRSLRSSRKCCRPAPPSICASDVVRRKATRSSPTRAAMTAASSSLSLSVTSDASMRAKTPCGAARLVTIGCNRKSLPVTIYLLTRIGTFGCARCSSIIRSATDRMCIPSKPPVPAASTVSSRKTPSPTKKRRTCPSLPFVPSAIAIPQSERRDGIVDLVAPAGLLHLHQAAAAAIGDPRLRDLLVGNRVVAGDIARTHDAGDLQHAQ